MSAGWCTIESDPGVFTELITKIGVEDVQMEELLSMDEDTFANFRPIYGLIFLFKWEGNREPTSTEQSMAQPDPELFFAKQVINNACATQAILSVLLNTKEIEVGKTLNEFREFTKDLPADIKGETIGHLDDLRNAHNSFARPEPFMPEEQKAATKDDDVFHFIAYVPFKGKVYEIDGLQSAPIVLGDATEKGWEHTAQEAIARRIEAQGREIRFSLMGVVKDQRVVLQERLDVHTERIARLQSLDIAPAASSSSNATVAYSDESAFEALMAMDPDTEAGKAHLAAQLGLEEAQQMDVEGRLKMAEAKHAQWKEENIRRKHNYVPLTIKLIDRLAKAERLQPMIKKAREQSEADLQAAAAQQKTASQQQNA